jgi:hypothetical protein
MPTFATPESISATIEFALGDVLIVASDRSDTVVEVRPSDASREPDVKAAEQTRVEYSDGRLLIKGPKPRGLRNFIGWGGSIDLTVKLPADSQVRGEAGLAEFRSEGQLGECRFKTGSGAIALDRTGSLDLTTGGGAITVDRVVGHAAVTTGSGTLQIREIDGTAVIKNSNGDTRLGDVTGDLELNAANGPISVERAHAAVKAKTANGSIRIGEVVRGSVVLETAVGELDVGIREGTAALLDVRSKLGKVRNSLDAAEGPEQSDETVEVRARTSYGNVVIHRS